MQRQDKIFIAGGTGMVGSAIIRALQQKGYTNLIANYHSRQAQDGSVQWIQLDLTRQDAVQAFLAEHHPAHVFLAAAKVGGIHANNTFPAQFIYENLMIQANIIHASHLAGVQKLLFLGSSCIYPRMAEQPMREDALLTGTLESTNEPYAIAKIAGIKLCESYNRQYGRDYRSVMPTNLYGPGDNFHPDNSHVIPALLRRFHEARVNGDDTVTVWGSGQPKREFLHVDDMADACVYVMNLSQKLYAGKTEPMLSHINVGTGEDCSIRELAETVSRVTGFKGNLAFDASKPDGTPRKLLDVSRLGSLGWKAKIGLEEGLRQAYEWYVRSLAS